MRTEKFASGLAMTPAAHQAAGRIVLVALAVAAVGAFTVLQVMAASGRRAPAARRRRPRARRDWRSLPQDYLDHPNDLDDAKTPSGGRDGYGPLWRYGAPQGYGRDYGPGHRPGYGPAYAPGAEPPRRAARDTPLD